MAEEIAGKQEALGRSLSAKEIEKIRARLKMYGYQ